MLLDCCNCAHVETLRHGFGCLQGLQHVFDNIAAERVDAKQDGPAVQMLQQSRTQTGRQHLVEHSALALLPPALKRISQIYTTDVQQPQHQDALVWLVQFARNLCAAGDEACISLLQSGVLATVVELTDYSLHFNQGIHVWLVNYGLLVMFSPRHTGQ